MKSGDVLSGELNALRVRDVKMGRRVATSRSPPSRVGCRRRTGFANRETAPETFQLVTSSAAQAGQLRAVGGQEISVKVDEVACAQDAGQMSEAVITKGSLIIRR